MTRIRRGLAPVLVASALLFTAAPASAIISPQAEPDFPARQHDRTPQTYAVVGNDTHDPTDPIRVIAADVIEWGCGPTIDPTGMAEPTVVINADSSVTVDMGPVTCAEPSAIRTTIVSYTIRGESTGQESTTTARFEDANPSTPLIAVDDPQGEQRRYVGDTSALQVAPLPNDTYGGPTAPVIEIVTQPTNATAIVDSSGRFIRINPTNESVAAPHPAVADALTYRISNPDGTSNIATVSWSIRVEEAPVVVHTPETGTTGWVWFDGASSTRIVDLRAAMAGTVIADDIEGAVAEMWTGLEPGGWPEWDVEAQQGATWMSAAVSPDGLFTNVLLDAPATTEEAFYGVTWRDPATGEIVAFTDVRTGFVAPYGWTGSAGPDQGWVQTGDTTTIATGLDNDLAIDAFPLPESLRVLEWVDGSGTVGINVALLIEGATLATETGFTSLSGGVTALLYTAGGTAGTDEVTIRHCTTYPNPALRQCVDEAVTVHVNPGVAATDDHAFAPEHTVTVVPLSNDVFNDVTAEGENVPAMRTAEVTLGEIPDGVIAVLNDDRTVTVTLPEGMESTEIPYSLRDWTGTSTARIYVLGPQAPHPDPTCETDPTLCPDPDPTCETDPTLCPDPDPTCETDPTLPECPTPTDDEPEPKEDPKPDPKKDEPTPDEQPKTCADDEDDCQFIPNAGGPPLAIALVGYAFVLIGLALMGTKRLRRTPLHRAL